MFEQTPRNHEQMTDNGGWWADSSWGVQELIGLLFALGAAGCAGGAAPVRSASAVERTQIAPGVELAVRDEAGPEARRIADEIRAKYASELITARPAASPHWPAR